MGGHRVPGLPMSAPRHSYVFRHGRERDLVLLMAANVHQAVGHGLGLVSCLLSLASGSVHGVPGSIPEVLEHHSGVLVTSKSHHRCFDRPSMQPERKTWHRMGQGGPSTAFKFTQSPTGLHPPRFPPGAAAVLFACRRYAVHKGRGPRAMPCPDPPVEMSVERLRRGFISKYNRVPSGPAGSNGRRSQEWSELMFPPAPRGPGPTGRPTTTQPNRGSSAPDA